jgi:hypothetical protein
MAAGVLADGEPAGGVTTAVFVAAGVVTLIFSLYALGLFGYFPMT